MASISSENLTVWKEQLVQMKWGNKDTRAVYIGWDSTAHPQDTARYVIEFKKPRQLEEQPWFSFEMAHSKEKSYPDKDRDERKKEEEDDNEEVDIAENENDVEVTNEEEEEDVEKDKDKASEPINISIAIYDQHGEHVQFDLHEYALLQPQITVDIYKNKSLQTNKTSEAVYQTFFFDLNSIAKRNPSFDHTALQGIAFIFDQKKNGVVILDKLAFH